MRWCSLHRAWQTLLLRLLISLADTAVSVGTLTFPLLLLLLVQLWLHVHLICALVAYWGDVKFHAFNSQQELGCGEGYGRCSYMHGCVGGATGAMADFWSITGYFATAKQQSDHSALNIPASFSCVPFLSNPPDTCFAQPFSKSEKNGHFHDIDLLSMYDPQLKMPPLQDFLAASSWDTHQSAQPFDIPLLPGDDTAAYPLQEPHLMEGTGDNSQNFGDTNFDQYTVDPDTISFWSRAPSGFA
ncbi:hypothetical protein B0H10DRAFT_1940525 [Mycena sp. CBHHK59/15]|nr:hypothetical protein B0H10DRAFT_1940525 [Mycena sp. CBHHK59/15]